MNTNYQKIIDYLNSQAIIITPNNRLAKSIIDDYLQLSPQKVLPKPQCFSYQIFLEKLYKSIPWHTAYNNLLNTKQTMYLWAQILKQNNSIVNANLIYESFQAWSKCQLWNIDINHQSFTLTSQNHQFQLWSQKFIKLLKSNNLITIEQTVPYIIQYLTNYPQKIIWFCFDYYTPQQKQLQNFFNIHDAININLDLSAENNHVKLCVADNIENELLQLIHWIKNKLNENKKKIGIVIPNLQQDIKKIKRFFKQQLPENILKILNISLGQPLIEYPLISHALIWLKLRTDNQNIITHHEAVLLLSSPFIANSAQEIFARAQFAQKNILLQEHKINFNLFITQLKLLSPLLADTLSSIILYPQYATITEWTKLFKQRLAIIGFAGDYSLNSINYQCYQRFLLLFDEFQQLQMFTAEISLGQALNIITEFATTSIFQAEQVHHSDTTIDIIGLLESSGSQFDALWIQGMDDNCLPKSIKFSSFIPIKLQKEYQLPYTNLDKELQFASQIILRLQNSSNEIIFSYAVNIDDQKKLPMSLLSNLPNYSQPISINNSNKLISYTENYKLLSSLNHKIIGNTALLSNQAKCPFRAFSVHKLHLTNITSHQIFDGINAIERGKILHHIMEIIWKKLQSQIKLNNIPSDDLTKIINNAINLAITPYKSLRYYSCLPLIETLEKQRLQKIIHVLLCWDQKRPNFTIDALEKEYIITLATIDFHIRIDRLDVLDNGDKWIIDYKNQLPKSTPWQNDRPIDPQILLYALLDKQISTLAFVSADTNEAACKGISTEIYPPHIKNIKHVKLWYTLLEQWNTILSHLAQEFIDGDCTPNPHNKQLCNTCNFFNLCRHNFTDLRDNHAH